MQNVRSDADLIPLVDSGATHEWWGLLSAADGIGLISLGGAPETQDLSVLQDLVRRLDEAGVAKHFIARMRQIDTSDSAGTAELMRGVLDALRESPLPEYEWPALTKVFGAEDLARLLRISESSLNRYANGSRATPDLVADRLHLIALIVGDLRGAYNEVGVRRWFHRHRSALGGRSPIELLGDDWAPDEEGPEAVRELAHSLLFASAT
jgi:transcriptional regulator with XRE-family HTH domain